MAHWHERVSFRTWVHTRHWSRDIIVFCVVCKYASSMEWVVAPVHERDCSSHYAHVLGKRSDILTSFLIEKVIDHHRLNLSFLVCRLVLLCQYQAVEWIVSSGKKEEKHHHCHIILIMEVHRTDGFTSYWHQVNKYHLTRCFREEKSFFHYCTSLS